MCGRYPLLRRKQIIEEHFDSITRSNSVLRVTQLLFQPLPFLGLFQMRFDRFDQLGDFKFSVKFIESFFPLDIAHGPQPFLCFALHIRAF